MRTGLLTVSAAIALAGCASGYKGPGEVDGWKSLRPPQANAIGKSIQKVNLNTVVLGSYVFKVSPENISLEDSSSEFKVNNYSDFKAKLDLTIAKVGANIGYEFQGSEESVSRNLKVASLSNIEKSPRTKKPFVYQCLVAGEYEFTAKRKSSAEATADVSAKLAAEDWGKALGLELAKIEVSSKPANPDLVSIKVQSPNVCLNYISAEFEDYSPWYQSDPVERNIYGENGSSKFSLASGEFTNEAAADVVGLGEKSRDLYRLKYSRDGGVGRLFLCSQKRSEFGSEKCDREIDRSPDGKWRGPQYLSFDWITNKVLAVTVLNIDAVETESGVLNVKNPRLNVQRYKLNLD